MHKKGQKRKRDTGQIIAQKGLFAKKPRTSSKLTGIEIKVVAGENHTFFYIKDKGGKDTLYASGRNYYGQLGLGDTTNRDKWTEVTLPDGFKIEKVIAGGDHSFLKGTVDGEAKLYACGDNQYGQLGLGHSEPRPPFEQGLTRQQMIDIPDTYSAYLQGDNKGRNKFIM